MEKNLVGKYTYKGTEYEYHYTDKLTLADIGGIAECVADELCYKGGVFNYRPVYRDFFIKEYILIQTTDILSVINFESEEEQRSFIGSEFNNIGNIDSRLYNDASILVDDLVEHKKQEYYHRDQLSEAIGSFVDVISDKLKDVSLNDFKKEIVKSITQVIHETNEHKKETKRNTKKNGQKKATDNVVPVNVLADKQ